MGIVKQIWDSCLHQLVSFLFTAVNTDRISIIMDRINFGCLAVRLKLKAAR